MGQKTDWVAGIAEFLQLDILQFVQDNAKRGVFTYLDVEQKQPDLSKSVEGVPLHVCGISPAMFNSLVLLGEGCCCCCCCCCCCWHKKQRTVLSYACSTHACTDVVHTAS
jgi:hypothetical protein